MLGVERGRALYTLEWLQDRVDFHLDPSRSTGEVWLALEGDQVLGHSIVRLEEGRGLFSTTYVAPEHRRRGVARALVRRGEEWLRERGIGEAATLTAVTNLGLQRLFFELGYAEVERREEFVKLSRRL